MTIALPQPEGGARIVRRAAPPYANAVGTIALAVVGAALIVWCTTGSQESAGLVTIGVLGVGQALVFWLADSTPIGYRVAASASLLSLYIAAFAPVILQQTPLSMGAALVLATLGAIPMCAVAVRRFVMAHRASQGT